MYYSLYDINILITMFLKISDHFPKISEDFPKLFRRLDERLPTFSDHFPKIAEDCRRLPKVAIAMAILTLVRTT